MSTNSTTRAGDCKYNFYTEIHFANLIIIFQWTVVVFAFSKFINSSNLANEKSNGLGFGIPKPAWKDIRESGKEYIKDLVARVQTAMSARATKKDDW